MKDFDAAFAEAPDEPITFRLFGRDWEVDPSPRAEAVLLIERLRIEREDQKKPLNRLDTIEVAKALVGVDMVNEWLGLGITMDQLSEVVGFIAQGGREADDEPGEAEPAVTPAGARSSSGGPSSKRTSNGSTGSTSRRRSVPA